MRYRTVITADELPEKPIFSCTFWFCFLLWLAYEQPERYYYELLKLEVKEILHQELRFLNDNELPI